MHLPNPRSVAARSALTLTVAAALVVSGAVQATAATTDPNPNALETANTALSETAATEGMVLLQNQDNALPMAKSGNVAVFGVGAYKTVKGGTGSGSVNNRSTATVRQGLENAGYHVTTSNAYWSAMTNAYDAKYGSSANSLFGPAVDYSSVEQLLTASTVAPTAATDTAIYVVARNSGEGADRSSGAGDYLLGDTEKADITILGHSYRHVVVVLNSGGIMDTTFVKTINAAEKDPSGGPAIDSLLLMSQPGETAGDALVKVLNGTVDPSGHLTDTWASQYSYYPASATFGANDGDTTTEPYGEGIYVGYRYFDSFYKTIDAANPAGVVNYPFGYGLSYTSFNIQTQGVKADAKTVTVRAKVTNTGHYSGKQVVEVYYSAPQTGIDKPYQELAAYGKTDTLAPGQSQVLTLTYDTTQMSSYNPTSSAYLMDPGAYVVRVGDSSRDTHVAAQLDLKSGVATELVNHELADQSPASELKSSAANFYTYATEAAELAAAPHIKLSTGAFKTKDDRSADEQNVTVAADSPYAAIDGTTISSTTAYLSSSNDASNWEGTGAPYTAKSGETVKTVKTSPSATLYDVAKGKISMKQFVAGLTVTQLANIVEGSGTLGSTPSAVGAAGYTTASYESLGIPGMVLSDGPAGLRLTQQIATTPTTYQWATAWPVGTMLAQTWNRDLITQVGDAVGKEMLEYGVTMWLAPGMNIHRDPLNGRNFEYYSEDPLVAGLSAAAMTIGVQSNPGVGVTVKHFAENSQEANRNADNAVVSERALREIELQAFEYVVKSAQPMAVMSSYNKIDGTWSSMNYDLLTDVLRGEWGFKGLVMSDWGGSHSAVASMYSGNDLIEPGGNPNEVINATKQVTPQFDLNGLPVYNKTTQTFGTFSFTSYAFSLGSLTLSATGDKTFATTVDSSTDLSKAPLSGSTTTDAGGHQVFTPNPKFTSVDEAYQATIALLAGTAFNATQKAAITISNVVHATPSDATSPVTAYRVTEKGSYPATYDMRLGDLQRSASRVLTQAMQSEPFAQLAKLQGVKGIHVASYEAQFGSKLAQFVSVGKSAIVANPDQGHHNLPLSGSVQSSGTTLPLSGKATVDVTAGGALSGSASFATLTNTHYVYGLLPVTVKVNLSAGALTGTVGNTNGVITLPLSARVTQVTLLGFPLLAPSAHCGTPNPTNLVLRQTGPDSYTGAVTLTTLTGCGAAQQWIGLVSGAKVSVKLNLA
ncbi:beta-glucosidase [Jatrophihabitans sp. GAS493]|uniref:glycoside hydrolase family 3 N-terminal domain-containing protein n=1 Tax=Jatrophihabitans sp. GAS493 TaxID=1907575 RepID=UPI000BB8147F|nr:glycoside hydrolase family 3 N-terminal domain-containing protein [Jatrophihabitans sp. GAS493]SOD73590.1 beta-glucosidase [Jatrophihabitans sp. GAS493]